jgi:Fe-S cluster biosynthesis and repair protein YggX
MQVGSMEMGKKLAESLVKAAWTSQRAEQTYLLIHILMKIFNYMLTEHACVSTS